MKLGPPIENAYLYLGKATLAGFEPAIIGSSPPGKASRSNALSIWPQGHASKWHRRKGDPGRTRTCNHWFVTAREGVQESNALSIWPQGQARIRRGQKGDPGRIRTCMNWFHSAREGARRNSIRSRGPNVSSKQPMPYPFGHRAKRHNCVRKNSTLPKLGSAWEAKMRAERFELPTF